MAEKNSSKRSFVLVHGAWQGGWCYESVVARLRAMGHVVYAPTLTGLAERAQHLSPEIGLATHVQDVAGLIERECLEDIVLCGHSYGGMVVTGVVQALPTRIKALVYLDAVVPDAGCCLIDYLDDRKGIDALTIQPEGLYIAPIPASVFGVSADKQAWVDSRSTLQPRRTFEENLPAVDARDAVSRKVYVLATEYNMPMFRRFADARRDRPDWTVIDLPYGHELMVDAPDEVVNVLLGAAV
ncbi:alpha/beta fold hydrolase [Paraburkholderia graminis]|uniref:alpha/beta fold hydrolase n=1 Tax=Paraburkholderia graminis TaxID=60548 RepID=UPI0038BB4A4E